MAYEPTTDEMEQCLAYLSRSVGLAEVVIRSVKEELKRLERLLTRETTSHLPQESRVEALNPELPLRDQLKFNAKPEPLGGNHADRLVSAARSVSTDDSTGAKDGGCSE